MKNISRRNFMISTAALGVLGASGVAANLLSRSTRKKGPQRLVFVSLNGGADALSILAPKSETRLETLRPKLFLKGDEHQEWNGFLYHNALQKWQPLWEKKQLAFVHQVGVLGTKSHAEEQKFNQSFCRQDENTLVSIIKNNKLMALNSYEGACYLSATRPHFLSQGVQSLMVSEWMSGKIMSQSNVNIKEYLDEAYKDFVVPTQGINSVLQARQEFLKFGAPTAPQKQTSNLESRFNYLAHLIRAGHSLEVAYIESHHWDTHAQQGVFNGPFNDNLEDLTTSVNSFVTQLGPEMDNTLIVITSEFGRSVAENGSEGSEHGTGGVMILIGGGVKGGKIYGDWTSLEENNLPSGKDLPVTTDTRDLWWNILSGYFDKDLSRKIFTDHVVKNVKLDLF